MAIDILREELLTPTEVIRRLPRAMRTGITSERVRRWCGEGTKGIRLDCVLIAGFMYTSREAVRRFFNAVGTPKRGRHAAYKRKRASTRRSTQ